MKRSTVIEIILCACVIALLGAGTYYRNEIWGSEISLWKDAVKKSPDKPRPTINVSTALIQEGRYEEAKYELERFLEAHPESVEGHNNLGAIYTIQGENEKAKKHLFEALRLDPYNAPAHNNIGGILLREKQYHEALFHFQTAMEVDPKLKEARQNYETVYAGLKPKKKL